MKNIKAYVKNPNHLVDMGYKKIDIGWERREKEGRFHARGYGSKHVNIHYDFFGKRRHVVIDAPHKLLSEKFRLEKLVKDHDSKKDRNIGHYYRIPGTCVIYTDFKKARKAIQKALKLTG